MNDARPTPAERRRQILGELYGTAGRAAAARLDAAVASTRDALGATGVDFGTAPSTTGPWLIAYPDHVTDATGRAPLAVLAELCREVLMPWIGGVHTLPIHPFSSDRGFAVIEPDEVEPGHGTWADVDALAAALPWMADAVVNHLSARSSWFAGFLAGEPGFAGFFRELPAGTDHRAVTRPRTSPLSHTFRRPDGSTVEVWTTFSADQVDLDFATAAVAVAVAEMVLCYVGHGAAAIRLDAIAFAWKDPATASMSLPQTHRLVQLLRACVDEARPGTLLLTETNVGHAENVSYFGADPSQWPEAAAVYQFPLPPLVLHAFVAEDATALSAWARQLAPPPPGCVFANMLATHDGIGVRGAEGWLTDEQIAALTAAAVAAGGVVNTRTTALGPRPYELAVAWWSMMSAGVDAEQALARHLASHAVALALRGMPLLYLNSLFAVGNDNAAYARSGHGRDLNRAGLTIEEIRAWLSDDTSTAGRCWRGLRALLDLRRAGAAGDPRAAQHVHDLGPALFAVERGEGAARTVVVVNVSSRTQRWALPGWGSGTIEAWGIHWANG